MTSLILYVVGFVAAALVLVVSALSLYVKHCYKYFEKRGIPFEPPTFPFGILGPQANVTKSFLEIIFDLYTKHRGKKMIGCFQLWKKGILIIDRELIKQVLVKDFDHFDGKSLHHNRKLEPMSAHLFAIDGFEWKVLRTKMTPVFSSGKLKGMFGIVTNVGHELNTYVTKVQAENSEIDCKDVFIRYGLAVLASTAFGLDCDVLHDRTSKFFVYSENLTNSNLASNLRWAMVFYAREIALTFNLRTIPKDTHEFYYNLVKDTVNYRDTHGESRNDFLQVLMGLRQGAKLGDQALNVTLNEMAAQAYVFILAGFETTSNAMSNFLWEMAMNPEAQHKVLAEIDAVDELTYDNINGMEYLDMCLDETLRKYPAIGQLGRQCSKDYQIPGTDTVIEKGTLIMVSTKGLHYDPDLFPDPESFIPERFSKENRANIKPYSYMPFGEGPRICIGMRFGKMIIKTGLVTLLKKFDVRTSPKTPLTIEDDPLTISVTAKGGMWLRFMPRDHQES